MGNERYLVIPDMHEPYGARHSLKFVQAVARFFRIPKDNVIQLGDTTDDYFASRFGKDPDAPHTATGEIRCAIERLKPWYRAYPKMWVCISNHNIRWAKKAFEAEIPSQMLRPYKELIEAPAGWKWAYSWTVKTKHPWQAIHGMGYSGMNGHRTAALDAGMSTIIGHLHAHAGVAHIKSDGQKIWGANAGCLVDAEAIAFAYGRESRFKPTLGCAVVLDSGLTPIFIPYEAL